MTLTDPARPQIGFRPAYGNPPIAVFPELLMWPLGGGLTKISCFLANAQNSFSRHETPWDASLIPEVLWDYRDNPEALLRRLYGWEVPQRRAASAGKVTLADLGL
jgi:hypothetical protein